MALMFAKTGNITRAVSVINELNTSKFPLLLSRILQKLHLKEEHAFSEEEVVKLQSVFSVGQAELNLAIETCEFFLHQSAYHSAKPAVLQTQLEELDLAPDKVLAIVTAWQNSAKDVIDKLRHRTLPAKQLDTVGWRLNLTMGSSTQTRMKAPNAIIELGVTSDDDKKQEKVRMEFTHEELYKFYNQLETIQSQIDSLS